jgi:hypothetical protein
MYAEKHIMNITTDATGAAVGYSKDVTGQIVNVIYGKTDFADGVDFAVTLERTGQAVWSQSNVNASAIVAPRQPAHDQLGAALLYAAAGEAVTVPIVAVEDRLKVVVAQGGDTKSGKFTLIMG